LMALCVLMNITYCISMCPIDTWCIYMCIYIACLQHHQYDEVVNKCVYHVDHSNTATPVHLGSRKWTNDYYSRYLTRLLSQCIYPKYINSIRITDIIIADAILRRFVVLLILRCMNYTNYTNYKVFWTTQITFVDVKIFLHYKLMSLVYILMSWCTTSCYEKVSNLCYCNYFTDVNPAWAIIRNYIFINCYIYHWSLLGWFSSTSIRLVAHCHAVNVVI